MKNQYRIFAAKVLALLFFGLACGWLGQSIMRFEMAKQSGKLEMVTPEPETAIDTYTMTVSASGMIEAAVVQFPGQTCFCLPTEVGR